MLRRPARRLEENSANPQRVGKYVDNIATLMFCTLNSE
jgi:hypothetical protein